MAEQASPAAGQSRYLDPQILQRLDHLELVARRVVEGMRVGMHRSPLRGFSTEFAQHRQYVPGDELKHIDWGVYARTNRYYVKLYEAETNFDAYILLDGSSSMRYGSGDVTKLDYAKYLAASLSYMTVSQRDTVGMGVFDGQLRHYIEPRSTQRVVRYIAAELEQMEPTPSTDVAAVLHEIARRMKRRSVVVLISDLLDDVGGFLTGLNHLYFGGHDLIVFHTLDPYELEFPFDGTTRFDGLENEPQILTQPRRVREAYLDELHQFLDRVRISCERLGADYLLTDTSKPLAATLSSFLAKRSHGG
jgi:uncharacterized protein (DUF58 family)